MTTTIIEPVQIVEIAETVWSSLFGMTVYEIEPPPGATHEPRSATATIHITGESNVSVVLSGTADYAARAAAAMFDLEVGDLESEEIADAFGEILNIIAGNVKALMPEPSELSLPSVSYGAEHVVSIPGARLLEHVELICEEDRLGIALWSGRDNHHA